MLVVGRKVLEDFSAGHADVRGPVAAWLSEVEDADWQSPVDVKARFPSASILAANGVIFNIKGNKYRLEVKVSYTSKTVFVKRIGSHAEYSKWTT
jgi:mRNA interferase HigB